MLKALRARIDRAVRLRVDPRFEELTAEMRRQQADYDARLGGTQADFSYLRAEFDRIAPQLAALEQRFEALRHQIDVADLDPESELERACAEHERARIRLELVAHYEERLRRLEED